MTVLFWRVRHLGAGDTRAADHPCTYYASPEVFFDSNKASLRLLDDSEAQEAEANGEDGSAARRRAFLAGDSVREFKKRHLAICRDPLAYIKNNAQKVAAAKAWKNPEL